MNTNKRNKAQYRNLRNRVFARDSYTCALCNAPASEVHHFKPRSHGGTDLLTNCVSICYCCHHAVHGQKVVGEDRTQEELFLELLTYLSDYYAGSPEYYDIEVI